MDTVHPLTFTVEKDHHRIRVEREFAAPRQVVWAAWTEADLIDQWWAPAPWKAQSKTMDVHSGGSHHYAMRGPGGEVHWGRTDYTDVELHQYIRGRDGFSDEAGNLNTDLPQSDWNITFRKNSEASTTVIVEITYPSRQDLETILEMGFQEGLTTALDQLESLLRQSYR
ncbi:uncharacterized protein YndB with AHSA1/START domain [Lewinella marina]|uniref:ATPase n=1 Tax=Neolewinella marina TaxID=438751 RepID=A0A2G0CEU2_9BACT|nr:SRPBCC domain-containing protein [Neolewinella marina]NJB87237.1 uncharacterized protein YndB with AHSA1/START domain [Neolewinella marina]PHK98437.1 ATPase [Neolewinella marina]